MRDISEDDISKDEATYGSARLLFVSSAGGVVLLTAVLWFVVGRTAPSNPPGLATWAIWGLLTLSGIAVWLLLRRKAVDPVTEWSGQKRSAAGAG